MTAASTAIVYAWQCAINNRDEAYSTYRTLAARTTTVRYRRSARCWAPT